MKPGMGESPAEGLSVRDCGAIGNGEALCTAAIQRGIDRCGEGGGGTLIVPAGDYVTGTLWMRSNVTLHLEAGARLLGSMQACDYPVWVSKWEGKAEPSYAALICGEGLRNVAVTGRGTIDGRGHYWWDKFREGVLDYVRPRLLKLVDCRDVLIEGVTCCNAGMWTLHPTACDNVTISRVTVRNPPDSPNTDGINPDSCSNVRISDCHIDVGDDCVTLKSGCEDDRRSSPRPCENVMVSNCTMLRGHGGVVIGSEMSGGVRNVVISNCIFRGTDRGIRIKSRRGRGGAVEDVRVDNIIMDGVLCPIVVNLFYGCGAWNEDRVTNREARPVGPGTPRIRRLRFTNILARRAKYAAAFILGLPEMNVDDVTLEGVSLYLERENVEAGAADMGPGFVEMCRAGIVLENAKNVRVRRVDLHDQIGPAVTIRKSSGVRVSELSARHDANAPLILTEDARLETIDGNGDGQLAELSDRWSDRSRAGAVRGNGNGG